MAKRIFQPSINAATKELVEEDPEDYDGASEEQ